MQANERLLNLVASFIVSDYGVISLLLLSMISFAIVFYRMTRKRHGPEMLVVKAFNVTVVPVFCDSGGRRLHSNQHFSDS